MNLDGHGIMVLMILPFILFILGTILILLSLTRSRESQVKGGGIIFIGPIPIVFSVRGMKGLVILLLLTLLVILILMKILM